MSRTSNSVTTDYVWDVNRSILMILQDRTNTYVYGRVLISATDSSGAQTYRLIDGPGIMIATYVVLNRLARNNAIACLQEA